jgi:glycosyltransferase involved in cell wall biosynthesis
MKKNICITEKHGMLHEQASNPHQLINYSFLEYKRKGSFYFKSPIKGYLSTFHDTDCDFIESIISPIITKKNWLYSLAVFQEALAFNFMGLPVPRFFRLKLIEYLVLKENCKKVIFWSNAGMETMESYGKVKNKAMWDKSTVIYPAIREVDDDLIQFSSGNRINLLFSGDFFIKGGANVVDAFELISKVYPEVTLRLCCDESRDFNTDNDDLKKSYLQKIKTNSKIVLGRVSRENMLNEILPMTDIYLLPTYNEAFGFAILEAMAYGIPVISTNIMAIPEMIEDCVNGSLINCSDFDLATLFKGCYVSDINKDFNDFMTENVYQNLLDLIVFDKKRRKMGESAIEIARIKFSFAIRNEKLLEIYNS